MNKRKIIGLLMLATTSAIAINSAVTNVPKMKSKNVVLLTKSKDNENNLSKNEVQQLKNKTITVNGMKFSGLKAIKIAPASNGNDFAVAPNFNANGFASNVNEQLYNYELNPANDQAAMNEATYLHGGNPVDTCVFFQSSALRAIGESVPYDIGYTTYLENWLANNGWTRHTDFQYIQRGDICFASYYHTFLFMGWENKAQGIAYVMGNESFTEPYYRNRNLNGQSPVTYGNNSYYQATCYWTYGQGYQGEVSGINPVHQGGYNSIGTATTTATLNLQSSPSSNSTILGEVPNGITVPVVSQQGAWFEVYYNGETAWIDGNYTDGLDESLGQGSTTTTMPQGDNLTVTSPVGLWLNSAPSTNSNNIVLLPNGTPVKALEYSNGWYKVNYEGTIGWLDGQYTSGSAGDILPNNNTGNFTTKAVDGTVTVDTDGLWINSKPFANDGNLIVVPGGTKLKATEESSNGWYKVTYKGQTGWIGGAPYSTFKKTSINSISETTINKEVKIVVDGLCLNKYPKANDDTLNVIPNGTVVNAVAESSNGWYKVTYEGQTGWIGGTPYSEVVSNSSNNSNLNKAIATGIITANGGLWLNGNPNLNNPDNILVIPKGETVSIYKEQGNWDYISYNGHYGWSYNQYINYNSANETVTINSPVGLWMNNGPVANSTGIVVIPYNTQLSVINEENGWYEVSYNGETGWIDGAYVNS